MNTHLPAGKEYPIASAREGETVHHTQGSSDGGSGMTETLSQREARYKTRSQGIYPLSITQEHRLIFVGSGGGLQSEATSTLDQLQSGGTGITGGSHSMGTCSQPMSSVTNSRLARDAEGTAGREFSSESGGMGSRLEQETGNMTSSGQKTEESATKEGEEEEGGFMEKVKKTLGI